MDYTSMGRTTIQAIEPATIPERLVSAMVSQPKTPMKQIDMHARYEPSNSRNGDERQSRVSAELIAKYQQPARFE